MAKAGAAAAPTGRPVAASGWGSRVCDDTGAAAGPHSASGIRATRAPLLAAGVFEDVAIRKHPHPFKG
eukprot:scaffold11242_cov75-Isochrysis_galbana.AAC.1